MAKSWTDIPKEQRTRICILYTGGTIGMKDSERGYVPAPGYINEVLASLPMFHDLEFGDPRSPDGSVSSDAVFVSPLSKLGKRACYSVVEYTPLVDSCNISHSDWARIAEDIKKYYDKYDAFIVLHGTDTMAYTASALSFMLQNLGKTVVVTGSQIPVSVPLNDGLGNLLGALVIAAHYETPEVLLYFNSKGMRGNRTTKGNASGLDGFVSANFAPLIEIGVDYRVNWHRMIPPPTKPFTVQSKYDRRVAVFRLFPGFEVEALRNAMRPPLRGLVLQTFGAGNAPDGNKPMLEALREASTRGVVIINCTQCIQGMVEAHYATGVALREVGVTPGYDMTVEAALTKLGCLFGQGLDSAQVRALMEQSIVGEFTAEEGERFTFKDDSFIASVYTALHDGGSDGAGGGGPLSPGAGRRREGEMKLIADALNPVLMCSAAGQGLIEQLKVMLGNGADPNCADYDLRTPLHVGAAEGKVEVVQVLLEHGANPNVLDRFGGTALSDAITGKHDAVAALLRTNGAELRMSHLNSVTRLLNAAAEGDCEVVELFLSNGLDPNLADYDGRSAAHLAACGGHVDVLHSLKAHGCHFGATDRWGNTPTDDARTHQQMGALQLLQGEGGGGGPSPTRPAGAKGSSDSPRANNLKQ